MVGLAVLIFIALQMLEGRIRRRPRRRKGRDRNWEPRVVSNENTEAQQDSYKDMKDPKNQMEAISLVKFERTRILNAAEARLLPLLEGVAKDIGQGHRVMAQTSLGELIRPVSPDKRRWARANASVNSKRLDFAIVNAKGYLAVAVEYQGSGHYHNDSFIRDAVKREALRKAGVPMIEVPKSFNETKLKEELSDLLRPQ